MDKVQEFVTLSGLRALTTKVAVERQVKAFCEEAQEFYSAMAKGDRLGMLDGLADMRFVAETLYTLESYSVGVNASFYTMAYDATAEIAGFDLCDLETAFSRVEENNLDKFDTTAEGAHSTISFWRGEGFPVEQEYKNGYWVTRLTQDYQGLYAGKILKRYGFTGVDLRDVV